MTVADWLGYGLGVALAVPLVVISVRDRRWWSWLQLAGLALLAVAALRLVGAPGWLVAIGAYVGPPALVAGLVVWRLHEDAGWFNRKGTNSDALTREDHERRTDSGVGVPPGASTCED